MKTVITTRFRRSPIFQHGEKCVKNNDIGSYPDFCFERAFSTRDIFYRCTGWGVVPRIIAARSSLAAIFAALAVNVDIELDVVCLENG